MKDNGVDATMNQKEFVSIDEKRALDQLYDYYESGFKTPFPQYFRSVTHGTNVMPHEYALARFKAMFPGDTSNMKNPETFFDLTEEESRFLYLRKNQTKNLQLLNDDDNTEIEAKMLNSLKLQITQTTIEIQTVIHLQNQRAQTRRNDSCRCLQKS